MMEDNSQFVEVTETKDIQRLLLGLLKEFHEICEQHHLYYVVFGGTMLGAVRHKNIIPWDDDIDVCMPRKDYDKFCEIVNNEYTDKFIVKNYPQKNYIYDYAKFCLKDSCLIETKLRKCFSKLMLYIDVFPVDGYPPALEERQHFDKLRFYHQARICSSYRVTSSQTLWKKPYVAIRYIKSLFYRVMGCNHYLKQAVLERQKYNFETCEYVSMQGAGWNEKGKLSKKVFMDRKLYQFGELQVWGISDYDEHLTRLYGDYMTPPPKEKQISNHSYKLYVKKEYLSYE